MTNDSSTLEGGNFDTTVETSETSYARHQYETSYADAEEHFSNINHIGSPHAQEKKIKFQNLSAWQL